MPKWTLKKQDATANAGSWLASIIDERGRVIQQQWCASDKACDEWFADKQTAEALKEEGSAGKFEETAEAVASEVVGEPATAETPTSEMDTPVDKEEESTGPRRRRR